MRNLYDVRLAIEDLAVRRAASGGDQGILDALDQEWRALDARRRAGRLQTEGPAFVDQDESFHRRLAEATGNEVAGEILRSIAERIRVLRIYDFTTEDRIAATIAEHLEIVHAVTAGDGDAAAGFMRAHIQRSANVVRERIGETLARMFEDVGSAEREAFSNATARVR